MIAFSYVNDYNGFMKRNSDFQLPVLFFISVLCQLAIGILTLGLIFYMRDRFALGPQIIGIFASSYTVAYFLGCMFLKRPVSRLRPRHAVEIASLGMMGFGGLIAVVPTVWMAFVCYMLYGLSMSLFWPPIMGWLTRGLEGQQLSRTISSFNISWSIGIIIAPYIAGLLTERNTTYPVYVSSGIMLLIFIIIAAATLLVPSIRATASSKEHTSDTLQEDHSTPLRYICWIGLFSGYFIFGITMNIFPIYARDILHYSESFIGLLLLVRGLLTTIAFMLIGRFLWWHYNKIQIYMIQVLLFGICLVGAYAVTVPMFLLFFFLFGIVFAGIYTNSIFHGAAGSIDRESRMAMHESILTFGVVLGSAMGGTLYQYGSFTLVMLVGSGISILALGAQMLLGRLLVRDKSKERISA